MLKLVKYLLGIIIKPSTTDSAQDTSKQAEGAIWVSDTAGDNRIKSYLDSADREVITDDQVQVLSNKSTSDDFTVGGTLKADIIDTETPAGSLAINADTTITGDLTVNGTTTTIDSASVLITDANIVLNDTGDDASSEGAGLTIERTGVDGSIVYEDALASKFKAGAVGSEKEIVDVSSAQTITNKSIDADSNTITNIDNADIKAAAGIEATKVDIAAADGGNHAAADLETVVGTLDDAITTAQSTADTNATNHTNHLNDTADSHDASAISVLDTGAVFTATDVEAALNEVKVIADTNATDIGTNDTDISNLQTFDTNLGLTTNGNGASQIGIEDSAAQFTATDVEGALAESIDAAQAAQIDANTANSDLADHLDANPNKHNASLINVTLAGTHYTANHVELALSSLDAAIVSNDAKQDPVSGTANEIDVAADVIGLSDNPIIPGTDAIVVPKGTAAQGVNTTDGAFRFNTTDNRFEGYKDGAFSEIGGAGGGGTGGLDLVYTQDFETDAPADIYTINGSPTTDAIVLNNTTTQISGTQSGKVSIVTNNQGSLITSASIATDKNTLDTLLGLHSRYLYDGNYKDVDLVVEESSDNVTFTESARTQLKTATSVKLAQLNFKLLSASTHYRFYFDIVLENNGKTLEWDNVYVSDKPDQTKSEIIVEDAKFDVHTGYGSTSTKIPYFTNERVNSIQKTGTLVNNSTDSFSFTAKVDCEIKFNYFGQGTSGMQLGVSIDGAVTTNFGSLTNDKRAAYARVGAGNYGFNPSYSGILKAGQTIRPHTEGAVMGDNNACGVSITATALSNNVVFEGIATDTEWTSFTPTGSWTSNTTYSGFYKRTGDSAEIIALVSTTGAPTSTALTINLPSPLSVDSTKILGNAEFDNPGTALLRDFGTGIFEGSVGYDSSNENIVVYGDQNSGVSTNVTQTVPFTWANSDTVQIKITLPIVGWSVTEPLLSVPVTNERMNSISLEGNDGRAITADTEDIHFSGSGDGWTSTGDTHFYTIQENSSVLTFSAAVKTTSNVTPIFSLYKNGIVHRAMSSQDGDAVSNFKLEYTSSVGEFSTGDSLSVRTDTGFTLNSSSNVNHYLNINETYAPRGYFLGNMAPVQVAYVKDLKASGTAGGTFTSGSYQTRVLNTLEGDTDFISLSSNQIILEPGKYSIDANAKAWSVNGHRLKIYNITDSADIALGTSGWASSAAKSESIVKGEININSSTTIEVQHRCQATKATDGLGNAMSFGDDEVYTVVKITKLR